MHAEEGTFHHAVETVLNHAFPGYDALGHEVRLPKSDRRADFVLTIGTPAGMSNIVVAVEVENDFEAIFRGVGQAHAYAGHFDHGIGVVAIPAGVAEEPELSALRKNNPVLIIEVPHDHE